MATSDEYAAWIVKNADKKGTADFDVVAKAYQQSRATPTPAPQSESMMSSIGQGIGNLAAGALRGAGSIGATLLTPYDMAVGNTTSIANPERRQAMDAGLQSMGAQPDSLMFKGGQLAGEIAGTAGAGGLLARGVTAATPALIRAGASAPVVSGVTNALATSGFQAGATPGVTNMLSRIVGGTTAGGASAGLVNPQDAGIGAVVGGVLPGATAAAGKAGGFIRGKISDSVAPEVADLAKRAKELGIDIPADRITNNKPMNALSSTLNYVPFSGRAASESGMESQLNKALSRTFGQDSDNVTQSLRKASDKLGGEFDAVLKNNTVKVDDTFLNNLSSIQSTADRELGSDGMKAINGQIDELLSKGASGEIDGQAAYNIKRTLDRIGKRNAPEAFHALELKGALMEALNSSIGPDAAAAFKTTRQQYGNMLSLEKIAQNGVEGGVSVARMANMKNINNPDLQELADIAAQFVKTRESQHGSMQRAVVGAGAGVLGGIPSLLGGAALGRGVNSALNSNMLRNALTGVPITESQGVNQLLQGGFRTAPVVTSR
jgi:hypothetical protein